MRKFYSLACIAASAACLSTSTNAQQLENSDFEGDWADCIPWTFYGSDDKNGELSEFVAGKNPKGWVISNVAGMATYYDGTPSGLGATTVGEKADGYNSASAVKLTNTPNSFMAAQIVPGYLTLGTTWSTAKPGFSFAGITVNESDGGTWGGIEFAGRPTGIEFMYKRSRGIDKPDEKSTVVAYLWKGHWTQKDVPAIIYMAGEPVKVDMTDRDRCVLGMDMTGCQGGDVTHTEDAELIAVINMDITENTDEWTKFSANFDYKSDATPEYFNLVIAAGDYFGGASVVGKDNSLIVDDVKLIYADNKEEYADVYPGKLNIEMNGGNIAENQDANVNILYDDNNKCTLTLPNFTLNLGGGDTNMGDIVVPDVEMTVEDGKTKYTGKVDGMSLLGGAIIADVIVNGTIDSEGQADFKIDVTWNTIPINVSFVGKGNPGKLTSGLTVVEADENAMVEYFSLQGIKVNADNLTPGIYIVRQGKNVSKMFVR